MISVIIPNFNYAQFLKKRIDSILKQTLLPDEIIFLDDNSTDNSIQIAKKALGKTSVPFFIVSNGENGGSVFKQWQKGIEKARGDYIWIAESDDASAPDFLKNCIETLEKDNSIGLCYCESMVINKNNRIIDHDFFQRIHNYIDPEKWQKNYIANGRDEVCNYLFIRNTIPNASAVVFRSGALRNIGGIPSEYKFSGDWIAYIKILNKWNIAYLRKALNYKRFHNNSVTHSHVNTGVHFSEALRIANYCLENFDIPENSKKEFALNILFQIKYSQNQAKLDIELLENMKKILGRKAVNEALIATINKHNIEFADLRTDFLFRLRKLSTNKIIKKIFKGKI